MDRHDRRVVEGRIRLQNILEIQVIGRFVLGGLVLLGMYVPDVLDDKLLRLEAFSTVAALDPPRALNLSMVLAKNVVGLHRHFLA